MSDTEAYVTTTRRMDYGLDSDWASCPADVLLEVLKQLDIQSLINCMDVNIYWRNVVEYYCEHANLWKKIVKNGFDDEGATLTEKSKLKWRDQFQAAQQWLSIKNANVTLRHCYKCIISIRNICVYSDNLIINNTIDVKYYEIDSFKRIKTRHVECLKYEETSSLIVQLGLIDNYPSEIYYLFLTGKFNKKTDSCHLYSKNLLKVHMDRCYFIDVRNVLWMYTASDEHGESKFLARYYGSQNELCSIHINSHNVYVLSRRSDVLRVDMECRKFEMIFHLNNIYECLELSNLYYLLHIYHHTLQAQNSRKNEKNTHQHFKTNVSHKGVSCVLEHGLAVILGYEDGKIEIYHKRTFGASSVLEMQFNIQSYLDETMPIGITAIDVYEDKTGHHLFVATLTHVYELLLYH